ncbi:hydroxyisourate hydrolase [Sessilibacter sp. MAH2]
MSSRAPITTHILDTHKGRPAADVAVSLYRQNGDQWSLLGEATTNADGRITQWNSEFEFQEGLYQLIFLTQDYFERENSASFYPQVSITFQVNATDEHYHVPLLLSAHGYSTYRGS